MDDTLTSDLDEMAGRQPRTLAVVDAHVRPLDVHGWSSDQHQWHLAALERQQLDGVQARRA